MFRPRLRLSRRWLIATAVTVVLCVGVAVGLLVVYPRVGASKIREKASAAVSERLGREVRFGGIDVRFGRAVLRDVEIRGPLDGDLPLVHVDRVEIAFDPWRSLLGQVRLGAAQVEGVVVALRRGADGRDNLSDIIERLRGDRAASSPRRGGGSLRPTAVTVTRARLIANDEVTGATALVGDGGATWKPGELIAEGRGVTATSTAAPKAAAASVRVIKRSGEPPQVAVTGGEVALYPKLSLTGIAGTVAAHPKVAGQFTIELAGGYGGVPGNLWTARGVLDPRALTASIDLEAAKFQLDRLAPILRATPVVDYGQTSVDTKVHLDVSRTGASFAGEFHLRGLNVGHPMIADKEVHGLDLAGHIDGSYDRTTRKLALTRGDFLARDVPFSITGTVIQDPVRGREGVARGPGNLQQLGLRLVIPPIDCQRVLAAIPSEMAPYMAGYKLRGVFDTDVQLAIDWNDLDATRLDGHVGIKHCRVTDQPADSPKRLLQEFEHYVEVDKGEWMSFVVGPSNADFVPFADISPYLIKSVMSTEDSAFYAHKGFIVREFRSALVSDLKAGKFRHGASSITMQMVKNVLLYREKTLARKLQELFLTWHVENTLEKDRILEIYFNVIEFGPGLYGIGAATKHYFGKPAKDINPVEAAFFSSILPSPKERYKQYCAGTLNRWTTDKIQRILAIMYKRDRLTQAEYDLALATPLAFVRDGEETEDDCLRRTKKAIKNARSTNPLRK